VAYADTLGNTVGGQLVLLHANRVAVFDQYAFAGEGWRRQELERDVKVESLLSGQARRLRTPALVEMATDLMPELAQDMITRYHPALFVIGRPASSAAGPERLTPIVMEILQAAHMPVLLVPEGTIAADPPTRVLIAADAEPFGLAEPAAGIPHFLSSLGAQFTVAHVSALEDDESCAKALQAAKTSGLFAGAPEPSVRGYQYQNPANGILEAVEDTEADLVVLMARPRSYLGELFHMSITAQVMHLSHVPVLVVPTAGPAGPAGQPGQRQAVHAASRREIF
jgi:nucleotide-binding universal stress UspA family protein